MAELDNDFHSVWERRNTRLIEFLQLRREQLGFSIQEIQARAKRRRLRKLSEIEKGEGFWLSPKEYPHLEQALELPPGFLTEVREIDSDFGEKSAFEILDLLNNDDKILESKSSPSLTLNTCGLCRRSVNSITKRYSLPYGQRPVTDGTCVCGGRSQSELATLLQLAFIISGIKSVLVLGGSPDTDRAFDNVRNVRIFVVRQKQQAALPAQRISEIDVIVIARGQIGHSVTAPYLNVLKSLPKDDRPIALKPRSSNITAIADEIIWARDEIQRSIKARSQ